MLIYWMYIIILLLVICILLSYLSGFVHLGLLVMCQKSPRQPEVCVTPDLPHEWKATLMFLLFGVISLTTTCFLLIVSVWKPHLMSPARWIAFFGSK